MSEPAQRYAQLVEDLLAEYPHLVSPPVTGARGYGASALKTNGKIFAMSVSDGFVVKLPKARVAELVEAGTGQRLDQSHRRLMKEWLAVGLSSAVDWHALAREALAFVRPAG